MTAKDGGRWSRMKKDKEEYFGPVLRYSVLKEVSGLLRRAMFTVLVKDFRKQIQDFAR